jgi:hypothetical protein
MLQAATGVILHNHRWLSVRIFRIKITALGFLLKRDFSSSKKQKVVKTISALLESTCLIL